MKLPFGMRNNKVIHISEISMEEKGLKCQCTCPKCEKPLIARLGDVRVHHFAHSNTNCVSALETALHLFAKEILEEHKTMRLPALYIDKTVYDDDSKDNHKVDLHEIGYHIEQIEVVKETQIQFDSVVSEQSIDGGVRPDIVLYKNGRPLLVEIAVTHYVDKHKLSILKEQGISAIEIDLQEDGIDFYNFNRSQIEDLIINSVDCKSWLYNKKEEEMRKHIKEQEALQRQAALKNYRKKAEQEQKSKEAKLARIKQYASEEYQQNKIKEYNSKISSDKNWQSIARELGITLDSVPEFLNIKVKGELSIDCNRRIWQSHLFQMFVKNRIDNGIKVAKVVNWLKKHSGLPINKDLAYTKDIKDIKIPDLTDAVYNYLKELEGYDIIESFSDNHPYHASFYIVYNDFKTMRSLTKRQIQEKVKILRETEIKRKEIEKQNYIEETEKLRISYMEERQRVIEKEVEEKKARFRALSGDTSSTNTSVISSVYNKVGVCRHCGKKTDDWITFEGSDGTCECRECWYKK